LTQNTVWRCPGPCSHICRAQITAVTGKFAYRSMIAISISGDFPRRRSPGSGRLFPIAAEPQPQDGFGNGGSTSVWPDPGRHGGRPSTQNRRKNINDPNRYWHTHGAEFLARSCGVGGRNAKRRRRPWIGVRSHGPSSDSIKRRALFPGKIRNYSGKIPEIVARVGAPRADECVAGIKFQTPSRRLGRLQPPRTQKLMVSRSGSLGI
jgi:hypothetical protein